MARSATTTFTAAAQSLKITDVRAFTVHIASGGTGTIFLQASFDGESTWEVLENGTFAAYPVTRRIGFLSQQAGSFRLLTDTGFTGSAKARLEGVEE